MSDPIVYIDKSEIVKGKLEELKAAMNELAEFVEANEPQIISYNFFLNETGTRMTVVAIHPDSTSMEFHVEVAGPGFSKFTELIKLSTIEVYGQVSEKVVNQLRREAEMLGSGTVVLHKRFAGFA